MEQQVVDPNSVWNFYKTMIHLRRTHPPFVSFLAVYPPHQSHSKSKALEQRGRLTKFQFYGDFTPVDEDNESIFAYIRSQGNFGYLIILNWGTEICKWKVPEDIYLGHSVLVIGNYDIEERYLSREVMLKPYEARIYTIRA